MRKIILLALLFIFIISSSVQALSWGYSIVVWRGKVYKVNYEEIIPASDIGKEIGKVKTNQHDMTGKYYGDFSNYYPKGTLYYEIISTSTSNAIAVKKDNQFIKADYIHKAPFHIMNIFSTSVFLAFIGVIVLIIIIVTKFRTKSL